MPVPPHIIRSSAVLPLGEAPRGELVDFGAKNLRGENIRQFRQGEASTRFGFTALGNTRIDGTSPTTGGRLLQYARSPVRIADNQIEAYSSKANAWQVLGRVPEVAVKMTALPTIGLGSSIEDVDATNGYLAISYVASALPAAFGLVCYLAIIDQATGAIVRAPEIVGSNYDLTPALLGIVGNSFVAVRYNATGTKLEAWAIDTTSKATISAGWVAFAASIATNATGVYTLCSLPFGSRIAVMYVNTSVGTNRATIITISATAVVGVGANVFTNSITPVAVCLAGDDIDTLWAAWDQGVIVQVAGYNGTNLGVFKATVATMLTMATGVANAGLYITSTGTTGKARVWANDSNAANYRGQMRGVQTTAGAAAADGAQVTVYNVIMARKPFTTGGRVYSSFCDLDTAGAQLTQANMVLCDWTNNATWLRPVSNPSPGLAWPGFFAQGKAIVQANGHLAYAMGQKRAGVYGSYGQLLVDLDFTSSARWLPCAWGNSTYLSGGLPSYYDGSRVAEIVFLIRPNAPTVTTAGTGLTLAVGRQYVAVYEEVDADGNWHQSGVSNPTSSGPVANKTITVAVAPLTISSRITANTATRALRVAIYATTDGFAAPWYRLATVANDTSAAVVSYADAVSDANLSKGAKLYEQYNVLGTALDKRPPPSFQCLTNYNGMLVGASGSDVWYSGQNVSGEGAWFNPIFQVPVPGEGDITALWVMDGTLFAAKRREIYAISGEAPSDNGTSGGLGQPRRLAVDVGCIESRSPCVTSLGVFFQSERGIEILTRAQAAEWIGQDIQVTLAAFPIVTAATVDPSNSGQVLIELAASESSGMVTGGGRTLVFDLSSSAWISTDRRSSSGGVGDAPSQSACIISATAGYRYAWMTQTGVVHVEDRTTRLDAGYWVTPLIETGWLHGFKNEQRVWRGSLMFQRYTAAGLKVEMAYDYAEYTGDSNSVATWSEADTLGQRQLEWVPPPRAESVKFRITATAPAVPGTGQGLSFIGVQLDLAGKQGPQKGTLRLDPALRR
jgi:hypothetical protein